ncbi:WD repeat-containing protein 47 [Armadillidium nasatum]|uniref:WD repeat-containing protein 47 n=1 Tax=Armadillidium nasatum TaxID=96803 RepID=A0A5N5SX35_9CRUS|nr:WD repeat-containing protein 47 [Armadillidium nasatum]
MPSAHLSLKEEDVVKLAEEFLQNRSLHITQLCLERETGIINGCLSDDALFLRQLILDGQWEDVMEFVQPLEAIDAFDSKKFHYIVLKYKYFELLCIKAEAPNPNNEAAVQELVKVLEELEKFAPNKEAHNQLCLYLTLPRFHEHADFRDWNPSGARVQCWQQVYPLVEKFLPADHKKGLVGQGEGAGMARNDRLLQLIIKGLLYESCVDFCQNQATGEENTPDSSLKFPSLLASTSFSDSDLSLLSWLQSIPSDTFSCPFEQKTLNVDIERLEKPSLEASWTEHLLVTPIKPKTFPHSAMPYNRLRATDIMSRSLNPNLDGLPFGLGSNRNSMIISSGDVNMMLFDTENVFTSSSYGELPTISEKSSPPKNPPVRNRSHSPEKRQSTDSLNKPALVEKSEKEIKEEKPGGSPPSLPPKTNTQTPTHNQTPNHQPPPSSNQHTPNHQYSHTTVSIGSVNKHPSNVSSPPLQPKMHINQHVPAQINQVHTALPSHQQPQHHLNNNFPKGSDESSELFNIYQRRQLQQQMDQHQPMIGHHQSRIYEHYNNNHMVNPGIMRYPTDPPER